MKYDKDERKWKMIKVAIDPTSWHFAGFPATKDTILCIMRQLNPSTIYVLQYVNKALWSQVRLHFPEIKENLLRQNAAISELITTGCKLNSTSLLRWINKLCPFRARQFDKPNLLACLNRKHFEAADLILQYNWDSINWTTVFELFLKQNDIDVLRWLTNSPLSVSLVLKEYTLFQLVELTSGNINEEITTWIQEMGFILNISTIALCFKLKKFALLDRLFYHHDRANALVIINLALENEETEAFDIILKRKRTNVRGYYIPWNVYHDKFVRPPFVFESYLFEKRFKIPDLMIIDFINSNNVQALKWYYQRNNDSLDRLVDLLCLAMRIYKRSIMDILYDQMINTPEFSPEKVFNKLFTMAMECALPTNSRKYFEPIVLIWFQHKFDYSARGSSYFDSLVNMGSYHQEMQFLLHQNEWESYYGPFTSHDLNDAIQHNFQKGIEWLINVKNVEVTKKSLDYCLIYGNVDTMKWLQNKCNDNWDAQAALDNMNDECTSEMKEFIKSLVTV